MTTQEIESRPFTPAEIDTWADSDQRFANWPVVYVLDGDTAVYVGETLNATNRMHQHLANTEKRQEMRRVRVVLDDEFNKSTCLDLESTLIGLFAGDGKYRVLNRNLGVLNADYFDRSRYRERFRQIFDQLRRPDPATGQSLFTKSIEEIQNSDLFKLSPFKALTDDQLDAVSSILRALFTDLAMDEDARPPQLGVSLHPGESMSLVVQGGPGTGKTIVAIYLMKLLADIRDFSATSDDTAEQEDAPLAEFFTAQTAHLIDGFRIGLVIPQQSLRESVKRVFKNTPGIAPPAVLSPSDVGTFAGTYDLLIVDETHRLSRRSNQSSAAKNAEFIHVNQMLFGADDTSYTQLDWIRAKSRYQLFLVDQEQTVRPGDLSAETLEDLVTRAQKDQHFFELTSQMRVAGGQDYMDTVADVLAGRRPRRQTFDEYEFRVFDHLSDMHRAVLEREQRYGLSRMVAGYGWKWVSKKNRMAYDIEIDGEKFRWNSHDKDWISSPGSIDEVGSIHTLQGYDLNYAGVIIGPELYWDTVGHRLRVDRAHYFDKKGKQNIPKLGVTLTDDDLLVYVRHIYQVLLTRGMRGTFVYAEDPALAEHLEELLPDAVLR